MLDGAMAEMTDSSIAVMTVRLSAALLDVPTADSKASKMDPIWVQLGTH